MKKFVSILVLALMLYNIMGYYLAYLAMVQDTKHEMKEAVKENDEDEGLVVIKLPYKDGKIREKDFELVDEDEFMYRGQMFDIARTEIKDNVIYFYCLNDKKEDTLNSALVNHIQNNTTGNNAAEKKSNSVIKSLIKNYLPTPDISSAFSSSGNEGKYAGETYPTLTTIFDIASPPPKFI